MARLPLCDVVSRFHDQLMSGVLLRTLPNAKTILAVAWDAVLLSHLFGILLITQIVVFSSFTVKVEM